jgi:hypothetical protein
MTNFIKAAVLSASAAILMAAPAKTTTQVPFNFAVNGKVLPAGEYRIEQQPSSVSVFLINKKTGERVRLNRVIKLSPSGEAYLRFEKTGDTYQLKAVV